MAFTNSSGRRGQGRVQLLTRVATTEREARLIGHHVRRELEAEVRERQQTETAMLLVKPSEDVLFFGARVKLTKLALRKLLWPG